MKLHRQMARDAAAFRARLLGSATRYERKEAPAGLAEVKQLIENGNKSFESFKAAHAELEAEVKKLGQARPETEAKLKKIEASLDAFEKLNQTVTLAEAKQKQIAEQVDEILKKLQRPGAGGDNLDPGRDAERKAFDKWLRKGREQLGPDEVKVLRVGDDTAGGYLAPVEFVKEIIKAEIEFSPMRPLVRVRQTTMRSAQIPKRTATFAAVWVAEIGTRSETTGLTYGLVEVPTHEMTAEVYISQAELEDSAFDMEAEITAEVVEQFGVAEGLAIVSGNAVGKPEGILENASVSSTNSGAAAAVTADGLLSLYYAIKTAYAKNATFILNRATLGSVRKLKDGNGQYLWMPGLASGVPNTINGAPYVEVPDMPAEAANAFPIAFGDWKRAYTLIDRISIAMLRDPYSRANVGQVKFVARRRIGGQVTLAEACRKLKYAV